MATYLHGRISTSSNYQEEVSTFATLLLCEKSVYTWYFFNTWHTSFRLFFSAELTGYQHIDADTNPYGSGIHNRCQRKRQWNGSFLVVIIWYATLVTITTQTNVRHKGNMIEMYIERMRLDKLYDKLEEIETLIEEAEIRLYNIRQKKISANNR